MEKNYVSRNGASNILKLLRKDFGNLATHKRGPWQVFTSDKIRKPDFTGFFFVKK